MFRKIRYIVEFVVVRALAFFSRILPHRTALFFGGFLGKIIWFLGIRKSVARKNFELCLGRSDEMDSVLERSYINFVKNLVELVRVEKIMEKIDQFVRIENLDVLVDYARRGEGLILCTGHLGNFELFGAALAKFGVPIDSVVMPMRNPYVERYLATLRARTGMKIIPINAAARYVLRHVPHGRHIALLYDQDAGSSGLIVPFCGVPSSTPYGPAVLAKRSGVKIAVGFIRRDENGITHSARVLDIIEPGAPAEETMTLLNNYLAAEIKKHPEQYFWAHRRFKSTIGYQ